MKHARPAAGLAAALIGFGAASAVAAPQVLAYTFTPLQCTSYNVFPGPPSTLDCGLTTLSGTFSFDDRDGDGRIGLDELLGLTVRDTIIVPGGPTGPGGEVHRVTAFGYAPATGLSFAAEAYRYRVVTGVSYGQYSPGGSSRIEAWLPTTTASVTAVPAPGSAGLWLAGVAALAWRRWALR